MLYGKFICAAKQQTIHPKTIEFYGSKRLYELLRIFLLAAPLSFPKLQASSQLLSRKNFRDRSPTSWFTGITNFGRPLPALSSGHRYCVSFLSRLFKRCLKLLPDLLKLNNGRSEIVLYLLWPKRVPRYCSKSPNICTTS